MSFSPLPSSSPAPMHSQITASLRKDHDIIRKVLKATEICIKLLKEEKEVPPAILLDTVDFITNFIDRCHHAKEEHGLFAALEATGMPKEGTAIGTMLKEHEEARKIAEQIKGAVESYIHNNNSPESRANLIHHCEAYVNHIDRHILKEDTRVFIIAERRLKGKESDVKAKVESVEMQNIGAEGTGAYEARANQLFASMAARQQQESAAS